MNLDLKPLTSIVIFCMITLTTATAQSPHQIALDKAAAAGFSGVTLVAQNGKITFEASTGKRRFETGEALQKTDIFELASVSKQFTAMIVMMLQERGKLQYDDPISQYVQVPYPNITIRHLLTHTSGLPDYQDIMDKHWDKTKVADNPAIIQYLNRYAPPALFAPNEKYEYSNTGYVLLASIAEKASGRDFIELCREWIFRPLQMTDTDIRTLEAKAQVKNFAAGHLKNEQGQYINANKFHASDYTVWLGNRKGPGRISSTAQDLLKWDQALYTQRLVSAKTLEQAFSPHKLNNGTVSNYGFGWDIQKDANGGRVVSHTGDNPGYKTIIVRLLDQQKTVIVLNNNAHETMDSLIADLVK
ncbi:MAG: beta-lactamase family protein [Spirosomaceae bacterium]|jgi:CubicO group peptidase (beta-lactamase class C family)|nr:beta-lactamase family protein [Spirosomataceae bacterium]